MKNVSGRVAGFRVVFRVEFCTHYKKLSQISIQISDGIPVQSVSLIKWFTQFDHLRPMLMPGLSSLIPLTQILPFPHSQTHSFFRPRVLTQQRNQPSTLGFVSCAPSLVIDYVESVWPVGERLLIAFSKNQCSRGGMSLCNASKHSPEDTEEFFFPSSIQDFSITSRML